MFTPNNNDLQFLFDSAGQRVLITDTEQNEMEQQAIITNPSLSESEERYIHTLQRINMGDLVTLDNNDYLVMTEVITPRNGKYKAKIRHCNFECQVEGDMEKVLIGHDHAGRPVYEYIQGDPIMIPAIVEQEKFNIEGGQISYAKDEIIVTVQGNETNLTKLEVNAELELMGQTWKVRHQDFTKKGLLSVVCMLMQSE